MKKMFFSLVICFPLMVRAQVVDSAEVERVVDSLINLSRDYTNKREFEEAFKQSDKAQKFVAQYFGEKHLINAACYINVGRIYHYKKEFDSAEAYYLRSKDFLEEHSAQLQSEYALTLYNLGIVYRDLRQYEKSKTYYLKSKDITEKTLGKEHPDYAQTVNNLATIYFKFLGEIEKAEQLWLEALSIREKILGKEHPDYAQTLNNLAALYNSLGQYEKVESLWIETKKIREKRLGKTHPEYVAVVHNLGELYLQMGQYQKAEMLKVEAYNIFERNFGTQHAEYAYIANGLALLYYDLGQFGKAEQLWIDAKNVNEKTIGMEHPDYAATISNLAGFYRQFRQYAKSEAYYLEAKSILEKSQTKSPPYAVCLANLGVLYAELGNTEKAELFFLEAKVAWEKLLGSGHPNYALNLINLADLYLKMNQYEKAENLYFEAREICETAQGKLHPSYILISSNLANIYWNSHLFEKAEPLFMELSKINENMIEKALRHLSEKELNSYLNTFSKYQGQLFSFFLQSAKNRTALTSYDNTLFYKGFLLNAANQTKHLALSDSTATEKFNLLKSYSRRLSKEYAKPILERDTTQVTDLEEKANTLEKDLARTVAGYGEAMRQVKWDEVQAALQPDEAAIEFTHFQYWDKKATDSILYAALVLRPGWEQPKMVYLCEQRQLDSLLNNQDATAAVQNLYALRGVKPVGKNQSPDLYHLLWQPLDSLLDGVKTVHFSPSGSLHRIAFHAIPAPAPLAPLKGGTDMGVLADRYQLNQLFSTRSLVVPSVAPAAATTTATLFGGISYEPVSTTLDSVAADSTAIAYTPLSTSLLNPNRGHRGEGWRYLPGTKQEVERLSQLMEKQHINTVAFSDTTATEERFKSLGVGSPSPTILHIATHGFFFPDPAQRKERIPDFGGNTSIPLSEHPLMRSGLLLAGANQAWKKGKPFPGREDGILTAYEIAQVNLTGTKLAVLSACETGLGDIQGTEGVMGLQRSLKMAGVEKLIVSLWQIPDKESAVFMERFYTQWLSEGKEIRDAFYETQQWMRKRYKDPFVWAGFVLVE